MTKQLTNDRTGSKNAAKVESSLEKKLFAKAQNPPEGSINGSEYYYGVCQGYNDAIALLLGKPSFTERQTQKI